MLRPLLSQEDLERIHSASLRLLRDTGLLVEGASMRDLLKEAGAIVDDDQRRVKFPEELVLYALQHAPKRVGLRDRRGNELLLEAPRHYHFSGTLQTTVYDYPTRRPRVPRAEDVVSAVRLADYLPGIAGPQLCVCPCEGVSDELADLLEIGILFMNTSKHCMGAPSSLEETSTWVDIAEMVSGDTSVLSMAVSPSSPLMQDARSGEILRFLVSRNVPLITLAGPLAGATSPVTLAGTLVLFNVESLFLLVEAQLIAEGAPVIYGTSTFVMDLARGKVSMGSPAVPLLHRASVELARYYGLPSYVPVGGMTSSSRVDVQSGAEKMLSYVVGLGCGANITQAAGKLANCMTMSLEQLVIDHEIMCAANYLWRGLECTDEHLAVDLIQAVGPGGHYLMEEHTLAHMRSEGYFHSDLLGVSDEIEDVLHRAHRRVDTILEEHRPAIPASHVEKIADYVFTQAQERCGDEARVRAMMRHLEADTHG